MRHLFATLFGRPAGPPIPRLGDLDQVIRSSHERPALIYKHSRRCPYCREIRGRVASLVGDPRLTVHEVVVQTDRSASRLVEDTFDVFHQTPQALLLTSGRCSWSASQGAITRDAIEHALAAAAPAHLPT